MPLSEKGKTVLGHGKIAIDGKEYDLSEFDDSRWSEKIKDKRLRVKPQQMSEDLHKTKLGHSPRRRGM